MYKSIYYVKKLGIKINNPEEFLCNQLIVRTPSILSHIHKKIRSQKKEIIEVKPSL